MKPSTLIAFRPAVSFLSVLAWIGGARSAWAQSTPDLEERVERLEKKNEKLEEENTELRHNMDAIVDSLEAWTLGDVIAPVGETFSGLGPAASKVYGADGLSIAGYGEAIYGLNSGGVDQFDALRTVLYVGYHFNDKWVLNTEIEFEHAGTSGGGSSSVEFAYLDYLLRDELNLRAGLMLTPMGFVNESHEATTFLAATRPLTEQRIMPSTWRENGVGVHGDVGDFSYRAYVMNGFEGSGFTDEGLRGGRQNGSRAKAEDVAFVARADWEGVPGVVVGASAYLGDSGQDAAGLGDTGTSIINLRSPWRVPSERPLATWVGRRRAG